MGNFFLGMAAGWVIVGVYAWAHIRVTKQSREAYDPRCVVCGAAYPSGPYCTFECEDRDPKRLAA